MKESTVVDLLFEGDLEAVTQGLENGLYSSEELDQPHNAQGFTPLISACQMGLDTVRSTSALLIHTNQLK